MDNRNLRSDLAQQNPDPSETKGAIPRNILFGSVEVQEDLKTDLLTPTERQIYQAGFTTLRAVLAPEMSTDQRWFLASPRMVSAIIGLQPWIHVLGAEAREIFQAFSRAGLDFSDKYTFLTARDIANRGSFINDEATRYVLWANQSTLGITLPERPPERGVKNELLDILNSLNAGDIKRVHLTYGLLSGFPLHDSQYFSESSIPSSTHSGWDVRPQSEKIVTDPEADLSKSTSILDVDKYLPFAKGDVTMEENDTQTELKGFLIDTRDQPRVANTVTLGGFGLWWRAPLPVSHETKRHCQKILQVDRELGLLDFATNQRLILKSLGDKI